MRGVGRVQPLSKEAARVFREILDWAEVSSLVVRCASPFLQGELRPAAVQFREAVLLLEPDTIGLEQPDRLCRTPGRYVVRRRLYRPEPRRFARV